MKQDGVLEKRDQKRVASVCLVDTVGKASFWRILIQHFFGMDGGVQQKHKTKSQNNRVSVSSVILQPTTSS